MVMARISTDDLKSRTGSLARQSLWNFLIPSKHPHNSLSVAARSKKKVLKQLDASLNELRHAVHFNRHSSLLSIRLSFEFVMGAMLATCNKMVVR